MPSHNRPEVATTSRTSSPHGKPKAGPYIPTKSKVIQEKIGFEYELDSIRTRHTDSYALSPKKAWQQHNAGDRIVKKNGYDITADIAQGYSRLEFVTDAFDEKRELPKLLKVIDNILFDIQDIKRVSLANQVGYLAAIPCTGAGVVGYFAGEGWVGTDKIPRLGGSWRHQLRFAAQAGDQLAGQLQLTGGFNLKALQKLMSGQGVGGPKEWGDGWQNRSPQFVMNYSFPQGSPLLYQRAIKAVEDSHLISHHRSKEIRNKYAAILAVMAEVPISGAGKTYDFGMMIAKTNYAKILQLAVRETDVRVEWQRFLAALLMLVNEHLDQDQKVNEDSPVLPHAEGSPIDLSRITFKQWVKSVVPTTKGRQLVGGKDLMTQAKYPGNQQEKTAMRTFGPYNKTDPGDRPIFELRSLGMNPVEDLKDLVKFLVKQMNAMNQ